MEVIFWGLIYVIFCYLLWDLFCTYLCLGILNLFVSQPRILMAMARDGLLPSFFSDVNKSTQVPIKSTVITGVIAATLAFFMDVAELAGMVCFH